MKLGVVIGRFQVATLTEGHTKLLNTVLQECDAVLVCIGVSSVRNTRREPLPFKLRQEMVMDYVYLHYGVSKRAPIVVPIFDIGNNKIWCESLDAIIEIEQEKRELNCKEIIIYGGRDSVVQYYVGKHETQIIENIPEISATKSREQIYKNGPAPTLLFRQGMIYASHWRYPTGFPTADAACFRGNEILLCRKPNRTQFQLPGGFFDPALDNSLENTALRELSEECNISADIYAYVGSFKVEDWRYTKEIDQIVTTVFTCLYIEGEPVAKDDIVFVDWFNIHDILNQIDDIIYFPHQKIISNAINQYISK